MSKRNLNPLARPFLKWAGGKRILITEISKYLPLSFNRYFEPFVGAGALLFYLQPKEAVINDINSELINCYRVIKTSVEELINELKQHINTEEYYYKIRDIDRDKESYEKLSPVYRASRIIYLNKTCYNGLFRVNSQGQFNVPYGKYKNPKIVDEAVLRAVSNYLSSSNVNILNLDFEESVKDARKNDFIYFDPPYDPVSDTASFTGYDIGGFDKEDQLRLKKVFDSLTEKGVKCLISNSATKFILDLYREYEQIVVTAPRFINSVPEKRGDTEEVLIKNF